MVPDTSYEPTDEDVKIIREWVKKIPYIVQHYDDEFLKRFIRGCKGRLERTKIVLENLNALPFKYPQFYGHFDVFDNKMQSYLEEVRVFLFPKTLKDDSSILFMSIDYYNDNHDPSKMSFYELIRYIHMILYITVWERFNKDKVIVVLDWRKTSLEDVKDFTPLYVKTCYDALAAMPFRVQAIHNIRVPPLVESVLNFLKSLAKKKIRDRVFFHSQMDSVFDSVPQELFPKDYGGDEPDIATLHYEWKKKVESYRDRLVEEHSKMKELDVIRKKFIGRAESVGSFRSLNVD